MADDAHGDRTEKATGKRRGEARKKGDVARSREVSSVAVLLAGASMLYFLSAYVVRQLSAMMVENFKKLGAFSFTVENTLALEGELLWSLALVLGPVLLGIMAAGILSNYLQVGNLFTLEPLKPKFSRVNPLPRLAALVSKQSMAELVKSIAKLLIIGWVAYDTIQKEFPGILSLPDQDFRGVVSYIGLVSGRILFRTVLVMIALAALDYGFQRWTYEKGLRMTKREVKEEFKQSEGDPIIKSRIRSVQRDLARRRMMAEVPKADVVITNPDHLAVALRYDREEMAAPKVLAKGAGWIAEKIKAIAREHRVPVVENKPLARVLYKTVELGQVIPSTLYQVVADVLAHVYRMKNRKL
ncbi:MAG TPA: flagellar biosynthesis protein FlhB [Thermodesulfobacteriota bacterium]|nr:flagellar biosynthesis protein FlhB [Thermodesulfobacteriota bacterium]